MRYHSSKHKISSSGFLLIILAAIFLLGLGAWLFSRFVFPSFSRSLVSKNSLPVSHLPISDYSTTILASTSTLISNETILAAPEEKTIGSVIASSSNTIIASSSPKEELAEEKPFLIDQKVPFTPQAPLANWADERQQDGCEEAASLMALAWAGAFPVATTSAAWERAITDLSDFEEEEYGEFRDAALIDIQERIFKTRFNYQKTEIREASSSESLISALEAGGLLLLPCDGRLLKNPYFKAPGPETHMVLVKGYDYEKEEFITNDPGTKRGADYRYPAERLFNAISPYPTGNHEPRVSEVKEFLLVER